jgi:hypothetical protein
MVVNDKLLAPLVLSPEKEDIFQRGRSAKLVTINVTLEQTTKAQRGSRVIALLFP